MNAEQAKNLATRIFASLRDGETVIVGGKSIDLVAYKDGKVRAYQLLDKGLVAIDVANVEVAIYAKKEVLHAPAAVAQI
ncbi:MAG: hypothetical protein IJX36_10010 [Thermoguttaceae bacterium]|nr:hypothetical protein [Thermoguttaceae bacterium]MBQ8362335.1 hypothetical protein [Thermoguttaceae bacterium]MBQ8364242.1 hypothetical protein [Thermoguttaceae bacterium]